MKNSSAYGNYRKPSWAPPAWLFGPVWTVLYLLIAVSFGYVLLLYIQQVLPFIILLPFLLNLVFNLSFTPIQFGLRNFALALLDIILVLGTLIWALIAIYGYAPWISYANIPYLAWVLFATVLQTSVTILNRDSPPKAAYRGGK